MNDDKPDGDQDNDDVLVFRVEDCDWRSPPGETVMDLCAERALPLRFLERSLGLNKADLETFLTGGLPVDAELAVRLEAEFGVPAAFWLTREENYRLPVVSRLVDCDGPEAG